MSEHLPECPVWRCCKPDERATMHTCICPDDERIGGLITRQRAEQIGRNIGQYGCVTEHRPIQRYYLNVRLHTSDVMQPAATNPNLTERSGDWVLYAEHVYALRACERRVLDAAEQAIRDALSGDGRNLYAELTALAAIDALRKESND